MLQTQRGYFVTTAEKIYIFILKGLHKSDKILNGDSMREKIKPLVISAMLLCLGYVLPFLTGQIPQVGNLLLPMHIPVLLCGMICGWQYGAVVGFITPLTRSLFFGMPILYPTAIYMAFELLTYGFISGLIYKKSKKHNLKAVLISLISAMLFGRIVYGTVKTILLGLEGESLSFAAFIGGAFTEAVPGIILQLILIPTIILAVEKINSGAKA